LDDSYQASSRTYRSQPIPGKTANEAVQEVVYYYIAGLAPEWTVIERTEDVGYGHGLNAQADFRQGDTSNGIGIQVYADLRGRSSTVVLMIQAVNCGEDVPGFPSGVVCWQGPV
jgi:hypothetical protein